MVGQFAELKVLEDLDHVWIEFKHDNDDIWKIDIIPITFAGRSGLDGFEESNGHYGWLKTDCCTVVRRVGPMFGWIEGAAKEVLSHRTVTCPFPVLA